ncbi:MAG: UvrB/UvrC motif-containing protein [Spirochaetales bacterium]|nr:UvrB/UvrC motif-containing protein [Spirochaetales bacterium]
MAAHLDLTEFLREWNHREGKNVRFMTTMDGREIMQVRLPLGVEQYELDGRPDGYRPNGYESWLDYVLEKVKDAKLQDDDYIVEPEEFLRLREESVLYYSRYLVLFQVAKYQRVIQDTRHNLEIARLVSDCYHGGDKADLLQYLPYIRRVNAVARAMLLLSSGDKAAAGKELEQAIKDVDGFQSYESPVFEVEKLRSLNNLTQLLSQITGEPEGASAQSDERQSLNDELQQAIASENYEQAARIRDRLKDIDAG